VIGQTATPRLVFDPVLPQLVLVVVGMIGLLYEAFASRSSDRAHLGIALSGLAAAAWAAIRLWDWAAEPFVLGDAVAADRFGVVATLVIVASAAVGCLIATSWFRREPEAYRGECYPLIVFATSGMTLIVVANDLIVTFLALEILSLSLYVLTGIGRSPRSSEAAVKYFLLGAFASAVFLYGVAMAYGATATTKIDQIALSLSGRTGSLAVALVALVLLAVGFAFKVSAVPFHMWTPDVYQGAPTPVTAFMSAATKTAAFFAFMRVFLVGFQPMSWDWVPLVAALATLSVLVGSIVAIAQRDVKRMLAYSSIAHAGFIFMGLTEPTSVGAGSAMFYLAVYSMMTLGAFGTVMLISANGQERTDLASYRGLASRRPGLAALMTVFMLSLAGIPPTGGFIAKVGVFGAAVEGGYGWLAVVGVVVSVAAAYFYLRVIVAMYMQTADVTTEDEPGPLRYLLGALAVAVIVVGVLPGLLTRFIDPGAILRW
jgi:NADH-quinone oxidoreductase subunit N